jgi:hypothetical protein
MPSDANGDTLSFPRWISVRGVVREQFLFILLKLATLYGARRFVTVFTKARHLNLS